MNVGIIGGGQLGRMLALAGYRLGMRFRILDPAADACAGHVAHLVCAGYDDRDAMTEFRHALDVVTYEFENVPVEAVAHLSERISVFPGVAALAAAQDRVAEKRLFAEVGLETASYALVTTHEDCRLALATVGTPAILKTRRLGYDGKGQAVVHTVAECEAAWKQFGEVPCILEERVPFERELSLVAVRGTDGRSAFYPWAENVHRDGMLRVTRAPAEHVLSEPERAARTGLAQMLERLQYVGVLAVEFFEVDGRLLANEFAPRVHNTGHWTIDGAVTSQFENHLRAICGLPLGATEALGAAGMVNLIGNHPSLHELLAVPDLHVHLYGKSARPGRKLGHVNVLRRTTDEREAALVALDRLLTETDTARSRP